MNVKFLNPFVEAATEVIQAETSIHMTRGDLTLDKEPYKTDDVTVIISMVGGVGGNVIFGMSEETAIYLASSMLGEKMHKFDNLASSGIAELGNVITGRASVKLSAAGFETNISPPALLCGKGAILNTLDYPRLVVPLVGVCGSIVIHLAIREETTRNIETPHIPTPSRPSMQ